MDFKKKPEKYQKLGISRGKGMLYFCDIKSINPAACRQGRFQKQNFSFL